MVSYRKSYLNLKVEGRWVSHVTSANRLMTSGR
jgi:hypothetical protein